MMCFHFKRVSEQAGHFSGHETPPVSIRVFTFKYVSAVPSTSYIGCRLDMVQYQPVPSPDVLDLKHSHTNSLFRICLIEFRPSLNPLSAQPMCICLLSLYVATQVLLRCEL